MSRAPELTLPAAVSRIGERLHREFWRLAAAVLDDLGWDQTERGAVLLTMRRRPLELTLWRVRTEVKAKSHGVGQRPGRLDPGLGESA